MSDPVVSAVRRTLVDPRRVCEQLGLKVEQASGSYVLIRCPSPDHDDSKASCSVHVRDGRVAVKCHACGWGGDVLHLVAAARGLDCHRDFSAVLDAAKELAGGAIHEPVEQAPTRAPEPERDYPPAAEVAELWESTIPVTDDAATRAMLDARGIDPVLLAGGSLARVLHPEIHPTRLPGWARYRGNWAVSRSWVKTGHRLLLRAYDCHGAVRSVRAWRVIEGETPKRLPPSGYRANHLVIANGPGARWLQGWRAPRIVIVEGEPDMLARSIASPTEAVIGILSGSWHEGFAARVPYGAEVDVLTHLDPAGDRYAEAVIRSLEKRANVRRWTGAAA